MREKTAMDRKNNSRAQCPGYNHYVCVSLRMLSQKWTE